jgi:hypothetical protein
MAKRFVGGWFSLFRKYRAERKSRRGAGKPRRSRKGTSGRPEPQEAQVNFLIKLIPWLLKMDAAKGHRREIGFAAVLAYTGIQLAEELAGFQMPEKLAFVDELLLALGTYTGVMGTIKKNAPKVDLSS